MSKTTQKRNWWRIGCIILIVIVAAGGIAAVICGRSCPKTEEIFKGDGQRTVALNDDGYMLEQVLIISRHNIRSPLSGGDSLLSQVTPHKWFEWTSKAGELSVKGGQLETEMGQFFRKYLEAKGFIPENWRPENGEVRFFANSLQRTIATSRFFASGMLPVANPEIEYHMEYGKSDPLFCPVIRYNNPAFEKQVRSEINALGGEEGMLGIGRNLKESYSLLEKVLDFKDSKYAKENNLDSIPTDDMEIEIKVGDEIKVKGGLSVANSAVDALKLQIYEEADLNKALFGHKMTEAEIKKICESGDMYQKICEGTKTLATQVMHPMIEEMKKELNTDGRKFTFLCGHDSTITSLATALGIKEYDLPETISRKTPIGIKMVFEKYMGKDGNEYVKIYMCYGSTDELRGCAVHSLENPPVIYNLEFEGLEKNGDGYYKYNDVMGRFDETSERYYDYYEEVKEAA